MKKIKQTDKDIDINQKFNDDIEKLLSEEDDEEENLSVKQNGFQDSICKQRLQALDLNQSHSNNSDCVLSDKPENFTKLSP